MIEVTINLKEVREKRGYSKQELEKLSGISRTRIVQIERGQGTAKIETLVDLAKGLNVKVGDLIKVKENGFDVTSEYF